MSVERSGWTTQRVPPFGSQMATPPPTAAAIALPSERIATSACPSRLTSGVGAPPSAGTATSRTFAVCPTGTSSETTIVVVIGVHPGVIVLKKAGAVGSDVSAGDGVGDGVAVAVALGIGVGVGGAV